GEYLANNVVGCVECHSTRDFTKFAGPIVPGSSGQGGELFGSLLGFPGEYYAPNITPYGIGEWTDGEVYRAVTSGVSRDGRALFPIMPYPHFGTMDKEDVYAVIAYIRTLKPVENTPPKSSSKFPMNFIINTIPKAPAFTTIPAKEDLVKYGEYITNAALCKDCHTQQIKGEYQMDKYMAGGFVMPMISGGTVTTANITPDKKTGIGNWTEQQFVSRFKMYADSSYVPATVNHGEFNTMMPWAYYSRMKEEDLKAIFAYLQSIKPVENTVVKFEPPTK
ncbi:MAG TPA: c-type cytochrome, partial [Cyclobacteriaceae bacterium]|nr:c-type cytochrome [Cyclobacteriaceae bacterium]